MGGVRAFLARWARHWRAQRHTGIGLEQVGIAGAGAGARLAPIDQGPPLRRILLAEQAGDRRLDIFRVAQVGVAVGKRQPARFDIEMLHLRARQRFQIVAFQDVERLGHRHPAAARFGHAIDIVAAVTRAHRLADARFVIGKIGKRHLAAAHADASGRGWTLHGVDHRLRHRSAIKARHSLGRNLSIGARHAGIADHRADRQRLATTQVKRTAAGKLPKFNFIFGRQTIESVTDFEAVLRHADGRRQYLLEGHAAVAAQGFMPAAHGARHADRGAAGDGRVEVDWLAVLQKHARRERRRRHLARIDGDHPLLPGQVNHHEAAAANAATERIGHAQGCRRRHCRVDGVAAAVEDGDGRLRGLLADGGNGAAAAARQRRFCRRYRRQDDDRRRDNADDGKDAGARTRCRHGWLSAVVGVAIIAAPASPTAARHRASAPQPGISAQPFNRPGSLARPIDAMARAAPHTPSHRAPGGRRNSR